MAERKQKKPVEASVEEKLIDGHYDKLLAAFRERIEASRRILKEYGRLMRDKDMV